MLQSRRNVLSPTILACALLVVFFVSGTSTAAYIQYSYSNTTLVGNYSIEDSHWWYGWCYYGRSAVGQYGEYLVQCFAYVDPAVTGWWNVQTGVTDNEADGWRQKKVKFEEGDPCRVIVTWNIDGKVKYLGYLNADNQMVSPLGDAKCRGFGNVLLTGLADGDDKVNGEFVLEEKATSVGIVLGPVNISVPTPENDTATLPGDDPVSAGNTKLVLPDSFIRWKGVVLSWAASSDGAWCALSDVQTIITTFDLEVVE